MGGRLGFKVKSSVTRELERALTPFALIALLSGALAGCTALPAAAPTVTEIEGASEPTDVPYTLVNVDDRVAALLSRYSGPSLAGTFKTNAYAANNQLHPGDSIAITVYESGGSTLFGSAVPSPDARAGAVPAGATTIPPQTIEADGGIIVPFVGRVQVVGRTPNQVARDIEGQLKGKAVDPQVIITLVNNASNVATVGGDVNGPRPVPLSLRGERLLDVIGAAGGAKFPAYETYVRVIRHGQVGMVLLQTVITKPTENIAIRPNDQIFLTRVPRTFSVMGATQKVSQYTFDTEKVTLAEAIARAGGPIDTIGNPGGIYVFRFEPWFIAKDVLGENAKNQGSPPPPFVPILYRIGLRGADGYFLAQAVQMRDKDVVLVTNAETTQLQKMLAVVRSFTGIAYDLGRQAALDR
jgi:polysaccharide export outer membrane protein